MEYVNNLLESEEKSMRGDREKICLDFVRQGIFTRNGKPICNPFTNKTYLEANDNEFKKEQNLFINAEVHNKYFGLLDKDRKEIEQILRIAKPNENASQFPDFLFENGFIEHFQVSSSKTNRKGAKHIKKMNSFVSKINNEADVVKKQWSESPDFNNIRNKQWSMNNPEHNHSFLVKSFKNNWMNHINSLNNYTGNKDVGIFMIDYPEIALSMYENMYNNWISDMSQGDMREPESFNYYRLTRDKLLMNYIYEFKDIIKYVIFVLYNNFEIIKTESIPYFLEIMPYDYLINPLIVKNVSTLYNLCVPDESLEK